MGLLEECQSLFGTDDLFKVLDLSRDANESKIKKAYYKMSLKVHPDKSTEDNLAENTQKFQVLSKIHKILSDKGTREVSCDSFPSRAKPSALIFSDQLHFRHIWSMVMLMKKGSSTKMSNGLNIGEIFIQKLPSKTLKNTKRNIKIQKKKKMICLTLTRRARYYFLFMSIYFSWDIFRMPNLGKLGYWAKRTASG